MDTNTFGTTTGGGHGFSAAGRISPYYEGVQRAGARAYTRHLCTYVPWQFPHDPLEEYRAVTERVTLWDTACERQIQIRGKEALAFADTLVTRDLRGFSAGRCTYTFVCHDDGRIIGDPVLLVVDDETVWLSISSTDLVLWVKGIALGRGADVTVDEAPVATLQLQGPKSRDVLRKLTPYPLDELRYFRCAKTTVAGLEAVISRTGWSGELGYEIYPLGARPYPWGREQGMRLWDAILAAGADDGIMVTPFQSARAYESGLCVFNHAQGEELNPLEFWRENLVDLDAGDFIGRTALRAIRDAGGPTRRMVGLKALSSDVILEQGEWDLPLSNNGRVVGSTRRTVFSPALKRTIAIALVDRDFASPGQHLRVEHPGGEAEMVVTGLPFIDPEGRRARA